MDDLLSHEPLVLASFAVVWLLAAPPAALVLGRAVRLADRRTGPAAGGS